MTELASKGPLDSLSKTEAFLAVLLIVAAASGNRSSELANLDRDTVRFAPDASSVSLTVLPNFLFKNQSASRTPSALFLPALNDPGSPSLCPVAAIRFLLDHYPSQKANLFLNPDTGAALTSATLSFWLCKSINWLLPEAIPRAHDVRKNAFSLAWVRGVPLSEITKQGFWSSPSVFVRRYLAKPQSSSLINCVAAGSR